MKRRAKDAVGASMKALLVAERDAGRCRTLTLDNGKEFAGHEDVAEQAQADVFFADPHAPWQRGTDENANGLLREYFPKDTPLDDLPPDKLDEALRKLNNRPRKSLGWETPNEVHFGTTMRLTKLHL